MTAELFSYSPKLVSVYVLNASLPMVQLQDHSEGIIIAEWDGTTVYFCVPLYVIRLTAMFSPAINDDYGVGSCDASSTCVGCSLQ